MRILLAEDNRDLNRVVSMGLQIRKYEVVSVFDGKEALEKIKEGHFDTVLLDIMMPKLDGLEVLKEIRRRNITTPVIMMTAKTELEDRCTGLDLGADDYVTKPFELKELLARVAAQTRRIEKYSGSDIIYKDLKLDTSNFCISSSNSVSLSIKEFDLLKFLIYNKEKSLTKDYILSNIWKNDNSKTEESLGLYIDYLKNKLEMIGSSVSVFADENGYKLEG